MKVLDGIGARIPVYIVSIALTLLTTYFTSQLIIAEKMGDRPTRTEVKDETKDIREQLRRELDTIKNQQQQMFEMIQETNKNVSKLLHKNERR